MKRSHSRRSYPFDKRVPLGPSNHDENGSYGYPYGIKLGFCKAKTSGLSQVRKNMHKKKQRQHDAKLCQYHDN